MLWMKCNLFNPSTINGHLYPFEVLPPSVIHGLIAPLMASFTTWQYKRLHFSLPEFVNILSTTVQGWVCVHWLQMPHAWAMAIPPGGEGCLPALSWERGRSSQKTCLSRL